MAAYRKEFFGERSLLPVDGPPRAKGGMTEPTLTLEAFALLEAEDGKGFRVDRPADYMYGACMQCTCIQPRAT